MTWLLPLVVAIPLLAAAFIALGDHVLPALLEGIVSLAAAAASCALSLVILVRSEQGMALQWFGGWQPRHGVALGINFAADPIGAGLAAFATGLGFLALLYSLTYMKEVPRLYDGLMLMFCAGMAGAALTGDLFNLFVWFELMDVAAYALAGFKVEQLGPVQGAFNFAITNTAGAYLMLIGIALAYARTGALNFAQIGHALAGHRPDALVIVAMTLILVGLLVRAAVLPFHLWAADAHAVAPVPVCLVFSGAMVQLGLYAVARVYWTVFAGAFPDAGVIHGLLLWVGLSTALLGAVMCFLQRHLKRLLAYSTISNGGIILAGVALLGEKGLAGAADMVLSYGFLKGGLFLACGVLLLRFQTMDELGLHGRGRDEPLLGVLFVLGAIGLIGAPYVGTFGGHQLIDDNAAALGEQWVPPILMVAAGVSAGAILRAGARIFLGAGPSDDPLLSPEPREQPEARDASRPLMLAVVAAMVALGLVVAVVPGLELRSEEAAARFVERTAYTARVLHAVPAPATPSLPFTVPAPTMESWAYGIGATAIALATAVFGLYRQSLPRKLRTVAGRLLATPLDGLRAVHSGLVGDYVAWLAVGTATYGAIWVLTLR